jgi:hypothetical protein
MTDSIESINHTTRHTADRRDVGRIEITERRAAPSGVAVGLEVRIGTEESGIADVEELARIAERPRVPADSRHDRNRRHTGSLPGHRPGPDREIRRHIASRRS